CLADVRRTNCDLSLAGCRVVMIGGIFPSPPARAIRGDENARELAEIVFHFDRREVKGGLDPVLLRICCRIRLVAGGRVLSVAAPAARVGLELRQRADLSPDIGTILRVRADDPRNQASGKQTERHSSHRCPSRHLAWPALSA